MGQSTRVSNPEAKTSALPSPTHVTLAVILQVREGVLQVLLWERAREPDLGAWSLPGGYLEPGETLEESIRRHLAAKVDVREVAHLEQLETLSDPDRYPREWQLATGYLGLVPRDLDPALPEDTRWFPVDELPADGLRPRRLHARRARAPAREALVHERRVRARPARVHALGATGDLRGGARASGVGDQSQARAPAPPASSSRPASCGTPGRQAAAPRRSSASAPASSRSPTRSRRCGRRATASIRWTAPTGVSLTDLCARDSTRQPELALMPQSIPPKIAMSARSADGFSAARRRPACNRRRAR